MVFPKQPAPLPGKKNQPPGVTPGSIGKQVPGKGKKPPLQAVARKKPTKAPPARPADGGSASENNKLAKQVGDRLRARDRRQFGDMEEE